MAHPEKVQQILQCPPEEIREALLTEMDDLADRHCRLEDYIGDILSEVSEQFIAETLTQDVQEQLRVKYTLASEEQGVAREKLGLLYTYFGVEIGYRVC